MADTKMISDGGPAFPVVPSFGGDGKGMWSEAPAPEPGMSLRDYFAAQALITVLDGRLYGTANVSEAAALAYRVADSMLAARAKNS